ncbi:hypothetical protein ACA910_020505 [Epithemia clementina (nom. ined.)]
MTRRLELIWVALAILSFAACPCAAFSVGVVPQQSRSVATISPLWTTTRATVPTRMVKRYMADDDNAAPDPKPEPESDVTKGSNGEEKASSSSSTSSKEKEKSVATTSSSEDYTNDGGMWKTALLAGPLFVKFVIVLLIKFLTDLVVFPLLWLYRLARLTKNKILKLFRKDPESPNSAPSS